MVAMTTPAAPGLAQADEVALVGERVDRHVEPGQPDRPRRPARSRRPSPAGPGRPARAAPSV